MHRSILACAVVLCSCAANGTDDGAQAGPEAAGGASGTSTPSSGAGGASGAGALAGNGGAAGQVSATSSGPGGSRASGGSSGSGASGSMGGGPGGLGGGSPASGEPGVWQNVTPAGLDVTGGNDHFGVQDVLADPVRPGEFYAFVCYQGVWKSTDFGLKWTKVTAAGSPIDQGKPWGEAIDPNPKRDPTSYPTLYAPVGNGPAGLFKSTDGGVTWQQTYAAPAGYASDPYMLDIDPNDSQHFLMTFHNDAKLVESKDGGASWIGRGTISGATNSAYVFFVTSTIWLMVSQRTESNGTLRTTDSGATWNKVTPLEHSHGVSQIYVGTGGLVYLPAERGIGRSTDYGATWTVVASGTENSIVATAKYLYAINGGYTPLNLYRSPIADGVKWASYIADPNGMSVGTKRVGVGFDGVHSILVSGNWNAGIWRYIEP